MSGPPPSELLDAPGYVPRAPRRLDLRRLAEQTPPDRPWFRGSWLGPGVTYLAGAGGIGKSSLMQHEATCGAIGRAYISEGDHYRSLVWQCEDEHDDVWRKQVSICEHESIPVSAGGDNLHLVSRFGCENALMAPFQRELVRTSLFDELHQEVNDLLIDVLWLDNTAHVFLGDHDNRTEVTTFYNALMGLVRGRPFSVVLVGHPGKAIGSEYSGSVEWENAARMRWFLSATLPDQRPGLDDDQEGARTDVRYLSKRKSNYSAKDYVRLSMRSGVLVPDAPPSHVDGIVAKNDERHAEETCIAGFRALQGMGIAPTDTRNSGDFLAKHLIEKRLGGGHTKAALDKAMHRLMSAGVFTRGQIGQYSNRAPKFGLLMKEGA